MASRAAENRRYAVRRTLLILLMGAKCRFCPERRPWKLEFHHTVKRTWNPHKTSRNRRVQRYAQDWANGECVLACGRCNKKLGEPRVERVGRNGKVSVAVEEPIPF